MTEYLLLTIFSLGYLAIVFEHNLKIDKLVSAIITMTLLWVIISVFNLPVYVLDASTNLLKEAALDSVMLEHFGRTAEIVIFTLASVAIVEIVSCFNGFKTMQFVIITHNKIILLWVFMALAFFLSTVIPNLTAAIVLITILKKIIKNNIVRMWYASVIVIASNAGGAFSPIGDITTTMLWIGNKVSTPLLMLYIFLPALVAAVVPCIWMSFLKPFKGSLHPRDAQIDPYSGKYSKRIFFIAITSILAVPLLKAYANLPPYMGMLFSLAIVAIFAEIFSHKIRKEHKQAGTIPNKGDYSEHPLSHAFARLEAPSLLFFLGILMSVAALEATGMLYVFANWFTSEVPMLGTELRSSKVSDIAIVLLGFISAIIDNVPLVAASLSMFTEPLDNPVWHFIAYSAGVGGSLLIIGSAAGVVAMGMANIHVIWYLKNISLLSLLGFLAGAGVFILMRNNIMLAS